MTSSSLVGPHDLVSFPKEALELLRNALGIINGKTIIDLASGISKEPFFQESNINLLLLDDQIDLIPADVADIIIAGKTCSNFNSKIFGALKTKGAFGLIWNEIHDPFKSTQTDDNNWLDIMNSASHLFLPLQHRTITFSKLLTPNTLTRKINQPLKHELLLQFKTEIFWTFKL